MPIPGQDNPLTDENGEVRELTEEDFAQMRPLRDVDPEMIAAVAKWRDEKKNAAPKP